MSEDSDPTQDVGEPQVSGDDAGSGVGDSNPDTTVGDTYKVPEFSPMQETKSGQMPGTMDRFFDVHIPIWAELGRVEMLLGDLMKLDEGSVLRLDRPVGEPVDVVSQGVKLASGEVVVIDDCFAVRIKEIEKSSKAFK